MKATVGFAKYDKELFDSVRLSIRSLPNGYKDIAYSLYVHDLKIDNSVLSERQKAEHKEILFRRVNNAYNPILQRYINKVKSALNHKVNPGGTVHTEWVIKNTLYLAASSKNKKVQWSAKINLINQMPDEELDATDYSAIDEHTDNLDEE